ncbi:MAG: glycosyltransferase family 2 protein [Chlamydiia bacterium]|nr:glycosyltransferase family 2 protein [Chlamydiia bacterium]
MIKSKKETRILPAEDFSYIDFKEEGDKSFTFIVLTSNNISTIDQNIDSILSQNYSNFRVVYIDQGSTDGTLQQIEEALKGNKQTMSLFVCDKESEVYEKYYHFVSHCNDDEVIIHLYGTDWLAHSEVLSCLSQSYMNPDVWLTYGQYVDHSSYQRGDLDPKPKKTLYKKRVQKAPWVIAPLKTFYAGLFKKLHVEAGFFLSIEDESALLVPMAELAKAHIRFIPNVLFIHNEERKGGGSMGRVAFMADPIKMAMEKVCEEALVDVILLSEEAPEDLDLCLTSCKRFLRGVSNIHVIYQCTEKSYAAYQQLKAKFPQVCFTRPLNYGEMTFKETILHSLCSNGRFSPYVLLSTDQVQLSKPVTLPVCIAAMRKTQAYGFYLHLGKEEEAIEQGGVYSWNIHRGKGAFKTPDALQMGLYRRLDLEKDLRKLHFKSIHDLISAWANDSVRYRLGLSFEDTRACHQLKQAKAAKCN